MKHIILSGREGCGKTLRAEALYSEHTVMGMHVVLEDEGSIRNSRQDRRLSTADVLITTRQTSGDLNETIEFAS